MALVLEMACCYPGDALPDIDPEDVFHVAEGENDVGQPCLLLWYLTEVDDDHQAC